MATTLEILAPYLPYGIEVEVKDVRREGHLVLGTELVRGQLIGITNDPLERECREKQEVAYSPFAKRHLWRWAYPGMITPILLPFSALCEPLEDGTVPAVALAYMIFDGMVGDGDPVHAGFDHFGNVVVAAGAVRVLSITPDWLFCPEDGNHAGPAEYRKLLEWHFAVGLEPGQYIEKVSSAAPIDKNTAL